jgi:DNA-binding Lrp family transcriptional regulator
MSISKLDRQIIECLQREPQMSNRAIAREAGVTQQTVASRIKAMVDGRIMRVMVQRDLVAAGYPILAFAGISVDALPIAATAKSLAAMTEIFSITICPGSPEILANVNVRSADDLPLIETAIRTVEGVTDCQLTICETVHKFVAGAGDLASEIGPFSPARRQEDLDEAIIELLVDDGRLSNREVGRRVGISEGSVRARLKRLTADRVIRLGIVCEPDRVGYDAAAYIFFKGSRAAVETALANLTGRDEVNFAATAQGAYDGVLMCVADKSTILPQLCIEDLRSIEGIGEIAFRPLLRTVKHRFDYIHIGGERAPPPPQEG